MVCCASCGVAGGLNDSLLWRRPGENLRLSSADGMTHSRYSHVHPSRKVFPPARATLRNFKREPELFDKSFVLLSPKRRLYRVFSWFASVITIQLGCVDSVDSRQSHAIESSWEVVFLFFVSFIKNGNFSSWKIAFVIRFRNSHLA